MSAAYAKWLRDVAFASQAACPRGTGGFPSLAPNYEYTTHPNASDPEQNTNQVRFALMLMNFVSKTRNLHSKCWTLQDDCLRSTPPAWSSAFVLVWDWSWRNSNDLTLAAEHYDRARDYLDTVYMDVNQTTGVMPAHFSTLGDWCAALGVSGTGGDCEKTTGRDPSHQGDHGTCFSTKHVSGIQNTFYVIRTHEAWLRAHAALGRPEAEAAVYKQRLAAARAGFNSVFFHEESKTYIDKDAVANPKRFGQISMQTSLALALTMRLAESDETASELKRDVIETMGGRMSTGLIGTRYLLQALADAGGVDTALDLLTQRSDPSWGYMLDQGPGTLWEPQPHHARQPGELLLRAARGDSDGGKWLVRDSVGTEYDAPVAGVWRDAADCSRQRGELLGVDEPGVPNQRLGPSDSQRYTLVSVGNCRLGQIVQDHRRRRQCLGRRGVPRRCGMPSLTGLKYHY